MDPEFKVLVVGCGSIGQRHIKNLNQLGVKKFILCDTNRLVLDKASHGLEDRIITTSFKDALNHGPDAAVICTPSSMHLDMSIDLAKRGVHLLIEKPLSHALEGVKGLELIVQEKKLTAMVAMCYRFHPVFLQVKNLLDSEIIGKVYHVNYFGGHYLPDWHPYADYRTEYASQKQLGGGVVLTSIHGLDNLRWLFGEVAEAHSFADKVSGLEMDAEDIAIGIFRMQSGAYVSWQSDFLQRINQHRMIIVGEKGTIRCDFIDGTVETFCVNFSKWYSGKIPYDVNTMYLEEMRCFLDCIEKKTKPPVDIREGLKTLRLALGVRENGKRTCEDEGRCVTA